MFACVVLKSFANPETVIFVTFDDVGILRAALCLTVSEVHGMMELLADEHKFVSLETTVLPHVTQCKAGHFLGAFVL